MTLSEGKQTKKTIAYTVVKDRRTGKIHHDCITLKTFRKSKEGNLELKSRNSITLSDDKQQELSHALAFIQKNRQEQGLGQDGTYLLVKPEHLEGGKGQVLEKLLHLNSEDQVELFGQLLQQMQTLQEPRLLLDMLGQLQPEQVGSMAHLLNIAVYRHALKQFANMLKDPNQKERDFQKLFEKHPWIFGSEYSEYLGTRKLTRNEQYDFLLRRSTDQHTEIIEIKTPLLNKPLFNYDPSHDVLYPCAELSKAVAQVQGYLQKLDDSRAEVWLNDQLPTLKTKAKIIIGHSQGQPQQIEALRQFNSFLHRIEIWTFDQLFQVARQVLENKQSLTRDEWQKQPQSCSDFGAEQHDDLENWLP